MVEVPNDKIRGRGFGANPRNRFEFIDLEREEDPELQGPAPKTQLIVDHSQSILTENKSPDVGFQVSVNPYRGCEHGCSYCYARPTHEYLGLSAGLDFETKILVKEKAPELLRKELSAKSWVPQPIAMSGVTDPYQPIERQLELTRRCLEVLVEARNPVIIITKNSLVTRDADLFAELAEYNAVLVMVSITSLDEKLQRALEPRTSRPEKRLEAIHRLKEAGVPVGVLVAPVIPGLTDSEAPKILQRAREAGAECAGHTILRLPYGVKDIFSRWLEQHVPLKKDKVLNHIREVRGGKLNDSNFKNRMRGQGPIAENISTLIRLHKRRLGFSKGPELSVAHFRKPKPLPKKAEGQLDLFE